MGTSRYDTSGLRYRRVCAGSYSVDGLGEGGASERRLREISKATSATRIANISVAKVTGRRPAPKRRSEMSRPTALMRMPTIAGTIPRAVAP
jgi:hypothetical protein